MQDKNGFIVFEDGGNCTLDYSGSEKWFENYNDALVYAENIVEENNKYFIWSVMIYEGPESLLHTNHTIGDQRILYYKDQVNYKEIKEKENGI